MTKSLPANPNLERLRNEAKSVLKAHKDGNPSCCEVLRNLHQFKGKPNEEILKTDVGLQEIQFALAMEYGFESWTELKKHVEESRTEESVETAAKPTEWLTLWDGTSLSKWTGVAADCVEMEGDTLVITEHPKSDGVRAEVGGASWDNYIISADVLIARKTPGGRYCVQLTGNGTMIYCQLMPSLVKIAYYCEEPTEDPKGFTSLAEKEFWAPEGAWFAYEMKAQNGVVTAIVNGEEILSAHCPRGTDLGFPGFLVNQLKEVEVRLKNIRIKFLEPTEEQLQEYEKDASYNWLKCKRTWAKGSP